MSSVPSVLEHDLRVAIVGGGPAGLYTALLLRKARSDIDVHVHERNRADETFGWGVVFSDQTLENFRSADEPTYRAITESFAHWDDIDVLVRGRRITSGGHGFSGIARRKLLSILQARAPEVGVALHFSSNVSSLSELPDTDIVVAADGVHSALRSAGKKQFAPDLDTRSNRFIWLGTTLPLDAFAFFFVENQHGVFQAHCYRFDESMSTFIVECDERSWRAAGLDTMDVAASVDACEAMFAEILHGHRLVSNDRRESTDTRDVWQRFTRVRTSKWFSGNVVLVGDAAHTAHFSIGSGTKLAMEDAIALARELSAEGTLEERFQRYQHERMTEALRLQNAARNSMEWFEHVKRYIGLPPEQFAYSLLTRSQRVSHENLRLRDSSYVEGVERWFAAKSGIGNAPPPMFTPFRLRDLELPNRVVLAPMDMYSAVDGLPNDFHLVHLGARALGGAALVMTEMVCVSAEARITLGCTGMYTKEHAEHWRRVVQFVHAWSPSKICLQLGHSGRKGSTRLPWEGQDLPLEADSWNTIGPSALPYAQQLAAPREMSREDMRGVLEEFVESTRLAITAGFDMLELHAAHGYLLSSFLTPVSNERTDSYGGSMENRLRFPLEVFSAMRMQWPEERPMSVRISASDWMSKGLTVDESVVIGQAFMDAGADIIHVSSGQTSSDAQPVYGRLYQTPFSDRIRNEAHVPTIAVGNVTDADQVNGIIASGRADLVAIGRPHLSDPNWTLHAAAELGYTNIGWPRQYHLGKVQLEREMEKTRAKRNTR